MASLKEIRERIGSIKSTQQITKAMKMVSAAKLRRVQQWIFNARPYANEIDRLLAYLVTRTKREVHPLMKDIENHSIKNIIVIVVTADKGLCGSFNHNIIREAENFLNRNKDKNISIICIGKKVRDYFQKRISKVKHKAHPNILEEFIGFFNELRYDYTSKIMNIVVRDFLDGKCDQVIAIYNEFKSAIQHRIVVRQLLPLQEVPKEDKVKNILIPYLFEPEPKILIDELVRKHLDVQIWRILLESSAAEQGARMTAMDSATDNAEEMIRNLNLQFNRKRQSDITRQIIEVASGAEAIR